MFIVTSCLLGADDADEPAGTDPEASAKGVTDLNSLRTFFFLFLFLRQN